MKQDKEEKQTSRGQTLHRLCSASGLLLSVVCCITLIHVELRIQEHHRLISHSVTLCDKMETEILRKVQQKYEKWQVMATGRHWISAKGWFSSALLNFAFLCNLRVGWYSHICAAGYGMVFGGSRSLNRVSFLPLLALFLVWCLDRVPNLYHLSLQYINSKLNKKETMFKLNNTLRLTGTK